MSGTPYRGPYSSAIGFFVIGRSPIGMAFTPVPPGGRPVVFLLPAYPDQFELSAVEDRFTLPAPEGWSR